MELEDGGGGGRTERGGYSCSVVIAWRDLSDCCVGMEVWGRRCKEVWGGGVCGRCRGCVLDGERRVKNGMNWGIYVSGIK